VPRRAKSKYLKNWEVSLKGVDGLHSAHEQTQALNSSFMFLMKEPHLSNVLNATTKNLEINIAQMLTFVDTEVDLHPWERFGNATYISNSETEIDLMALMRDSTWKFA
jgi:hypothetical protein